MKGSAMTPTHIREYLANQAHQIKGQVIDPEWLCDRKINYRQLERQLKHEDQSPFLGLKKPVKLDNTSPVISYHSPNPYT